MGIEPTGVKIGPPRGGACRGCEPAQTYLDNGTCPVYKPMGDLDLVDDVCDLNLMKPGLYEFRPRDGEAFNKNFDWKVSEVSHASLANMITTGGKHVVL